MKYFLLIISLMATISSHSQKKNLVLISRDKKGTITRWLKTIDPAITMKDCYKLSYDSLDIYLSKASGIVISGGEDVDPALYNKRGYYELCGSIDYHRDTLEIKMIHYAMEHKIPLLAICRGIQILNVANGGTLIPDIPSFIKSTTRHDSKEDKAHLVRTTNNSWLKTKMGIDSEWVNSRHHQAVDLVAPAFQVSAFSDDGIIESIEPKDKVKYPFIYGVQWHPEDLKDTFSLALARLFINSLK